MPETTLQLLKLQKQTSNLSLLSYTLQKQIDALRDVLDQMNPQAVGNAINAMMAKLPQDELYQGLREQAGLEPMGIEKPA